MTFSIVAIDKDKREIGFAIASCCWDAGQVCRLEVEKGAIASQANGNMKFLALFFEKLNEKMSLTDILNHFKEVDPDIETRQIGMVSFEGEKQAFTGKKCCYWAGQKTGEDYSCQGNTLVGPEVVEEMVKAFEGSDGPLFERLFAALKAGDDAGGDARGKQSARLSTKKIGGGLSTIDISIEDHLEPVKEIGRIIEVGKNTFQMYELFAQFSMAADVDKPVILREIEEFFQDKTESKYLDGWENLGQIYYDLGDMKNAVRIFRKYLEIRPSMAKIFRENAKSGLLSEDLARELLPLIG